MCITGYRKKLFGVALDAADDPWSLQLKQAWIAADTSQFDSLTACPDPYEAVVAGMADILAEHGIEPAGRVEIPTWLQPKPSPDDLPRVTVENMSRFFDSGELLGITERVKTFVTERVLPEIPIMLGVDHAATAGVVSALTETQSPNDLAVIVLDQHFDAISLSARLDRLSRISPESTAGAPVGYSESFCCGNFWAHLMNNGTILPENLVFIGTGDYPREEYRGDTDDYVKTYLDFERRGCRFFPLERFGGDYREALAAFLRDSVRAPRVYVSLDIDVGSYNGTYAARYMDRPGLDREQILGVARAIVDECRKGTFTIA
ncbi:unnamed protein product, partial [marine sediment metagenome]